MIHIIADSTFGIPKSYAESNGIKIVNLKLILDDKVTEEGFEENYEEFYVRLKNSKSFPSTSQPSPEDFVDKIKEVYAEDSEAEIIILTISEALSGTINAATLAAREFEGKKIVAIDSAQAATCGRIMVEELVDLIKKGKTFEEIVNKAIPVLKENLEIQFVPETMEYLKRGGRIGKLAATLASILKIKPVFSFKNGMISIKKKVLGIGKAISDMIALLPQKLKKLYVCYIYDDTNVDAIKKKLEQSNIKYDGVVNVTPVFGSHVGIGAIGLASLKAYEI